MEEESTAVSAYEQVPSPLLKPHLLELDNSGDSGSGGRLRSSSGSRLSTNDIATSSKKEYKAMDSMETLPLAHVAHTGSMNRRQTDIYSPDLHTGGQNRVSLKSDLRSSKDSSISTGSRRRSNISLTIGSGSGSSEKKRSSMFLEDAKAKLDLEHDDNIETETSNNGRRSRTLLNDRRRRNTSGSAAVDGSDKSAGQNVGMRHQSQSPTSGCSDDDHTTLCRVTSTVVSPEHGGRHRHNLSLISIETVERVGGGHHSRGPSDATFAGISSPTSPGHGRSYSSLSAPMSEDELEDAMKTYHHRRRRSSRSSRFHIDLRDLSESGQEAPVSPDDSTPGAVALTDLKRQGTLFEKELHRLYNAESNDLLENMIEKLTRGNLFLKYGRSGQPHLRRVWVTSDMQYIRWADLDEPPKASACIRVSEITQVFSGFNTDVFRKNISQKKIKLHVNLSVDSSHKENMALELMQVQSHCFSLFVENSRSLDLQVIDGNRDEWVHLFDKIATMQREDTADWRRMQSVIEQKALDLCQCDLEMIEGTNTIRSQLSMNDVVLNIDGDTPVEVFPSSSPMCSRHASASPSEAEQREEEVRQRARVRLDMAIRAFNLKPKRGIKIAKRSGLLSVFDDDVAAVIPAPYEEEEKEKEAKKKKNKNKKKKKEATMEEKKEAMQIAGWLHAMMFKGLDREAVGEYLGKEDNIEILRMYLYLIDFENLNLVDGLRYLFLGFKPPGEAQVIERVLCEFSKVFFHHTQTTALNVGSPRSTATSGGGGGGAGGKVDPLSLQDVSLNEEDEDEDDGEDLEINPLHAALKRGDIAPRGSLEAQKEKNKSMRQLMFPYESKCGVDTGTNT